MAAVHRDLGVLLVIENTIVAIGGLPGALGAPSIIDQAAGLATAGWAFWLEWYAIRLSLQVGHCSP